MRNVRFLLIVIVFILLSSCKNTSDNQNEFEGFRFDGLSVDLTDATMIGISTEEDMNQTTMVSLSNITRVSAKEISDNILVKETDDGDIVELEFSDEDNEIVELTYSPIYVERRGNFTVSIILADNLEIYGEIEQDIAWFVPLMLASSDPVSMVFGTGITDMGYQMLIPNLSPAINVVLIHDDGTVYDLHDILHRVTQEKVDYFETFSEIAEASEMVDSETGEVIEGRGDYLPVNFVQAVNIYDDSVQFILNHSDYLSVEYNERENYFYVNTFTHNIKTNELDDVIYTSELKEQFFTPTITDIYGNTLVLNDNEYMLLKDNVLSSLDLDFTLRESFYLYINNEIYILGYTEFNEIERTETLFLGKINQSGEYVSLGEYESNNLVFERYRTGYYGYEEYYGKTYFLLEKYSFVSGSINEDRLYIQGSFENVVDSMGLELDFNTFKASSKTFEGQLSFKVDDQYFWLNENSIEVYNFDTNETSNLVSDVVFIDFYMEPYHYLRDYIYLTTDNEDKYYINIFTGDLYINDIPDVEIFADVELAK